MRFHTPKRARNYTILTHGHTDMIVALLGNISAEVYTKNLYWYLLQQVQKTTPSLLWQVTMMLEMAKMQRLLQGLHQIGTTSYKYRPSVLKEESLNSQLPLGDSSVTSIRIFFELSNIFKFLIITKYNNKYIIITLKRKVRKVWCYV